MARLLSATAAVLMVVGPSWAQTPAKPGLPAAPPAPASSVPERTTATFGDWVMRCEKVVDARLCEVAIAVTLPGQQGPIAQMAIGRPAKAEPLRATVVVPPNIVLPSTPRIVTDEKDGPPIDFAWQRCLPGGCFASLALKDDVLKRLRARTDPGRLEFTDATGRVVGVPLSLRGLPQAMDALAKEP